MPKQCHTLANQRMPILEHRLPAAHPGLVENMGIFTLSVVGGPKRSPTVYHLCHFGIIWPTQKFPKKCPKKV